MSKKKNAKVVRELPPDVVEADLTHAYNDSVPYSEFPEGTTAHLMFYRTGGSASRRGDSWVLTTLRIGGAGRGASERYYGIDVASKKVCRVGKGPHVLDVVTVYVSKANKDRLWKYVDLHQEGLAQAGGIRDRISTRRAQGQIHRANGERFWTW
jgi:hypothetical protein